MKRFDADLSDDQLKEKIIDVADKRLRLFGYKKTAMAEIAQDLGMSTANLYRYFPSKLEIAEAFALRCFAEKEQQLAALIDSPKRRADENLKRFAVGLLQYNFTQLNEYPKINEIVMALCEQSPDLVERKKAGELSILKTILEQGCQQKCWQIDDIEQMGLAIMISLVTFSTPTFMQHQTLEQLTVRLGMVLQLLSSGLYIRE